MTEGIQTRTVKRGDQTDQMDVSKIGKSVEATPDIVEDAACWSTLSARTCSTSPTRWSRAASARSSRCRKYLHYRWTGVYMVPGGYGKSYPHHRINCCWYPVILFTGGENVRTNDIIIQDVSDYGVEARSEAHIGWENSIVVLTGILNWADPQRMILDPCCGNSKIGDAAIRMRRRFIGFEADAQRADETRQRLTALANGQD